MTPDLDDALRAKFGLLEVALGRTTLAAGRLGLHDLRDGHGQTIQFRVNCVAIASFAFSLFFKPKSFTQTLFIKHYIHFVKTL